MVFGVAKTLRLSAKKPKKNTKLKTNGRFIVFTSQDIGEFDNFLKIFGVFIKKRFEIKRIQLRVEL